MLGVVELIILSGCAEARAEGVKRWQERKCRAVHDSHAHTEETEVVQYIIVCMSLYLPNSGMQWKSHYCDFY